MSIKKLMDTIVNVPAAQLKVGRPAAYGAGAEWESELAEEGAYAARKVREACSSSAGKRKARARLQALKGPCGALCPP